MAQHRDKRNNLSGIKLGALCKGFDRLCQVAKAKNGNLNLFQIKLTSKRPLITLFSDRMISCFRFVS